jgi:hypothetical protein
MLRVAGVQATDVFVIEALLASDENFKERPLRSGRITGDL